MPNNHKSDIADSKIIDYLLSEIHDIGKHKAKFFKKFGFEIDNIKTIKDAIIEHANTREVYQSKTSIYGDKFELKCEIVTPDKRNPCIITVWIIENGKDYPKFITAYPNNQQ